MDVPDWVKREEEGKAALKGSMVGQEATTELKCLASHILMNLKKPNHREGVTGTTDARA